MFFSFPIELTARVSSRVFWSIQTKALLGDL